MSGADVWIRAVYDAAEEVSARTVVDRDAYAEAQAEWSRALTAKRDGRHADAARHMGRRRVLLARAMGENERKDAA